MFILAFETSTTSAKAMLFEVGKGIVDTKAAVYPLDVSDGFTQNADKVNDFVLSLGKELVRGRSISAIALGCIWHSFLLLNESYKPVSPTYLWPWNDAVPMINELQRDADFCNQFYNRTGCYVHSIYPVFKLMYLKRNGLVPAYSYISNQGSYLFHYLTGERQTPPCTVSGSGFLNTHTRDYDDESISLAGAEKKHFEPLCDYRDTRPLNKKAAGQLGVSCGIPVVPAYPDGALNQVGAAALKTGIMTLSVGTSAALRLSIDSPVLSEKGETWCYLSPDSWLCGAAISGATNCLDWYVKSCLNNTYSYKELDKLAENIGANAPVFLPFLFGERCPGWNDGKLGGFNDVHYSHGVPDFYYSILEGICFNLLQCFIVLKNNTHNIENIMLSGGIVKSPFWAQMLADILGEPLSLSQAQQDSLLGAVVLGLCATGVLKNPSDFTMISEKKIYPNVQQREFYASRFERYLHFYNVR